MKELETLKENLKIEATRKETNKEKRKRLKEANSREFVKLPTL